MCLGAREDCFLPDLGANHYIRKIIFFVVLESGLVFSLFYFRFLGYIRELPGVEAS